MNDTTPSAAKDLEKKVWQLMKAGRSEEAAATCDQLNQAFPEYASGWNTSSRLAISLNEPVIALQAVQQALTLSPGKPEFLLQQMASLAVFGDRKAAGVIADEIATHVFETAYHASTCAVTMNRLERHADAEFHYLRAVELNPNNPNYRYNLATAQRFMGKLDEASANLDRAIELNPADTEALMLRSGFRTYTESDNNIDALKAAFDKVPIGYPGRVQLHFALAKELDDLGRYEESFEELEKGSAQRRTKLNYDARKDLEAMRSIREQFTKEDFEAAPPGHVNAEAIFIIGLPRSGTALVERVLNNHPVVKTVGEPQSFGVELVNACERVLGSVPSDSAQLIGAARKIDFAELGEAYVKAARPNAGPQVQFVDKLGMNFMYAGLIHLALPKAKIILAERDPMDNAYAAFKTLFPGAFPYTYDLKELANYFVGYSELMAHWQALMPEVIHTVRYEDLVASSKAAIEDLLEYCDLSFDEKSLKSFLRADQAGTVSGVRMQQELRAQSVGHWRNYRQQFEPVAEIFRQAGFDLSDADESAPVG
ncbi:MAG: sulfotransferase [Woeseiaceae bacterium]